MGALVGVCVSTATPGILTGQASRSKVVILPIDWQPRLYVDSFFAANLTKAIRAAFPDSGFEVQLVSAGNWERSRDSGISYMQNRYRRQGYAYLVWGSHVGIPLNGGQLQVEINVVNLRDGKTERLTEMAMADLSIMDGRHASLADNVLRIVQGKRAVKSVLARCFRADDSTMARTLQVVPAKLVWHLKDLGFETEHDLRIDVAECNPAQSRAVVVPSRSWQHTIGGSVLHLDSSRWAVEVEIVTNGRSKADRGFRANPTSTAFSKSLAGYIRLNWCERFVRC